jgi:hypothetical protein
MMNSFPSTIISSSWSNLIRRATANKAAKIFGFDQSVRRQSWINSWGRSSSNLENTTSWLTVWLFTCLLDMWCLDMTYRGKMMLCHYCFHAYWFHKVAQIIKAEWRSGIRSSRSRRAGSEVPSDEVPRDVGLHHHRVRLAFCFFVFLAVYSLLLHTVIFT